MCFKPPFCLACPRYCSFRLTLSVLRKKSADDSLNSFSYYFPENGIRNFTRIVGDNLHEMTNPIFGENKKDIINLSSAEIAQRG